MKSCAFVLRLLLDTRCGELSLWVQTLSYSRFSCVLLYIILAFTIGINELNFELNTLFSLKKREKYEKRGFRHGTKRQRTTENLIPNIY